MHTTSFSLYLGERPTLPLVVDTFEDPAGCLCRVVLQVIWHEDAQEGALLGERVHPRVVCERRMHDATGAWTWIPFGYELGDNNRFLDLLVAALFRAHVICRQAPYTRDELDVLVEVTHDVEGRERCLTHQHKRADARGQKS